MAETEQVKPAMDAEGWAYADRNGKHYAMRGLATDTAMNAHALAALALYGQPFGFTHEDVRFLENLVFMTAEEAAERQASLIARISALLPPEKP